MQAFLAGVVGVVALVVAVLVLGLVGPVVAVAGLVLVAVVLVDPGGAGARLRRSPGWWAIPGMRATAAGAAPFGALLFLYAVAVPMLAFALAHSISWGSPRSPAVASAVGGVSAGEVTTGPTPTATSAPAPTRTAVPAPTPASTPAPAPTRPPAIVVAPLVATARPQPTPVQPGLCGAPANPWNYTFCGGAQLTKPAPAFCSYFPCTGSFWTSGRGYVVQCADGLYARHMACGHDARERVLYSPKGAN